MVMLVLAGPFAGFTYVRPIIEQVAELSGETIALALLLYGLAGLVGNTLGGILAQRSASGGAIVAALLIGLAALTLVFLGGSPIMAFVSVTVWGLAFGAFPVCITTWTAKAAPDRAESAGALIATSFQVAIAYRDTPAGAMRSLFESAGDELYTLDPQKIAQAIFEIATSERPPVRVTLGGDAYEVVQNAWQSRLAFLQSQEQLARSVAFDD